AEPSVRVEFAQFEFVDLAGHQLGQLRDEDDFPGLLVAGDLAFREFDEFAVADADARLEHDDRADAFAPLRIGHADHRAFGYGVVLQQRVFDFPRINVFAAGNDHVFLAVDQMQHAVLVEHAHVAGVDPAVANGVGGGDVIVPVAAEHRGAARDDFARHARRTVVAVGVDDARLHAGEGLAHAHQPAALALAAIRAMHARRQAASA